MIFRNIAHTSDERLGWIYLDIIVWVSFLSNRERIHLSDNSDNADISPLQPRRYHRR